MKHWNARQLGLTLGLAVGLWLVMAAGGMFVGSTGVFWPSDRNVFESRLDPVLVSSLVGAALAAAGVVYQAILRNPLAEPYLLGVSSGASLAAYLWRFPATTALLAWMGTTAGVVSQQAFAFAGALVTIGIVFALSTRRGRLEPLTLLLVGVIMNVVLGAGFLLVNAFFPELTAQRGGPFALLVGDIPTNLADHQLLIAAIVAGLGFLILMYLTGPLTVALLSEAEAEALGVRIHRLRWAALIVASLVTAAAVALTGPIGFIGLICPHLARLIVGNDQRKLLPLATGIGAGLLTLADAAARFLPLLLQRTPAETRLPVGVLTALLGGPFFLLLLYQTRRRGQEGS